MKIVVTNPPWDGVRAGSRWPSKCEWGAYFPYPIHLAGAVSTLRAARHEVIFLDAVALRMRMANLNDYVKRIAAIAPSLIIQEISTPSIVDDRVIAERLSAIAPLAVSGPHATTFASELMLEWPFLHAALQGEIERNAVVLADKMERRVYGFDAARDLDEYPDPAMENLYLYRDVPGPHGGVTYQAWASRGCPWRCKFCVEPWSDTGKASWRVKSVPRVVEECRKAHELFPKLDGVYFDGPTENVRDERCCELADGMSAHRIPFAMMTRVDTLAIDTWDYMIDRGLYYVKAGMESANQTLIDECGKRLDFARVRDTISHLKSRLPRRHIHLTCMWGIPGETLDTVRETMAFLIEMGVHWQESFMAPVPGTAYWQEAADRFPVVELAAAGHAAPGHPEVSEWVRRAKEELCPST